MGWLKKLTRPISKVLDKIIPNEIKPALPYLSAFAPFMLGPGSNLAGASAWQKLLYNPATRAGIMGGLNIGSQLAQEGSEGDFSGISALLAAGTGYGTAGGAPGALSGMKTDVSDFAVDASGNPIQRSFLQKARDTGITGLEKASEFLTESGKIIRDPSKWGMNKETLGAFATPITQGTADLAMIDARQALDDYNNTLDEGSDVWYDDDARRVAIRRAMEAAGHVEDDIVSALSALGLRQGGIVGLRNGGRIGFDNGGTPIFTKGSILKDKGVMRMFEDADKAKSMISKFIEEERAPNVNEIMEIIKFIESAGNRFEKTGDKIASREDIEEIDPYGVFVKDEEGFLKRDEKGDFIRDKSKLNPTRREPVEILMGELIMNKKEKELDKLDKKFKQMLKDKGLLEQFEKDQETAWDLLDMQKKYREKWEGEQADEDLMFAGLRYGRGPLQKKADGGMMSVLPRGVEMDYRGGGMIPMGSKERADDVPARLSKNEFVMTADAVRAAGGGSVNRGAKRMYDLMHNLEARV